MPQDRASLPDDYALAHKISRVYARSPVMRRDREDLVQEAVMGLIGKPEAPRSCTMTRRIVDYIRRETHRGACPIPDQLRSDAFAAAPEYLAIEERLDLLKVLRKMVAALEAGLDASVVEELDASDGRKRLRGESLKPQAEQQAEHHRAE